MKSNWDVANIKIAKSDVSVAWVTGAKDDCRANRIRRSRFPIDVRKPWKNSSNQNQLFQSCTFKSKYECVNLPAKYV